MAIRRRGLWALGILLGIAAAFGGWVAAVHLRAQAQIAEHADEVEQACDRIKNLRFDRPVPSGEPVDGNAWELYEPAFRTLVDSISTDGWVQIRRLEGHPHHKNATADEALVSRVLDRAEKAVASLRDGLRRKCVDPGFDVRGPQFDKYVERLGIAGLALEVLPYLVARAHARGDDGAALDLAAVLLAVAQDLARGGSVAGAYQAARAEASLLIQVAGILSSCSTGPTELRLFTERLSRLDSGRASFREILINDDLKHRAGILRVEEFIDPFQETTIQPGWRCLFSKTMMRAQALNLCRSAYRRLMDSAARPPMEQERLSEEIEGDLREHRNGVVFRYLEFDGNASVLWTVPSVIRDISNNLMHRVLLRVATALALYQAEHGRDPERLEALVPAYLSSIPNCPLTGRPVSFSPGRIGLPGRNGVDDGGVAPDPEGTVRYSGGNKDIVWAVARKKP